MIALILAFALQTEPIAGVRASAPLEGVWVIEVEIDSAHARVEPQAHRLIGTLRLNAGYPSPLDSMPSSRGGAAGIHGIFRISFGHFWGVWPTDVAGTVMGFPDALDMREMTARVFTGDSVELMLSPRLVHGAVTLTGRLSHEDSMAGTWVRRAWCCGATGRFTAVRVSRVPPPMPPRVRGRAVHTDTLLDAEAGRVFVRVFDEAVGRHVEGRYDLKFSLHGYMVGLRTGTGPDGFRGSHKLLAGSYRIDLTHFPCGEQQYWLEHEIRTPFVIRAGERTEVTIRLNSRTARPARSYINPDGKLCSAP